MDAEQSGTDRDLAPEILGREESEEELRRRFFGGLEPAIYSGNAMSAFGSTRSPNLINLTLPRELCSALRFTENKDWSSLFPPESASVHTRLVNGAFTGNRYFTVSGIEHCGLVEDALDIVAGGIRDTVREMQACRYSEHQIELSTRAAIVIRVFRLLHKDFRRSGDLLRKGDSDNILEIIWGTRDLSRFEFQSSAFHKVVRAYIPWHQIKKTAMKHAAKEAAKTIGVDWEEMYDRGFRDVEFPPAQVWGILLCTRLFEVCTLDTLYEWWLKYAIPEYLQRGEHDRLIIDPRRIDRWAPEQYA